MKLFIAPGACSMAPHILLEEVGASFETYKVDLRAKKLANGDDFLKINPKGQVPTLQTESGDILTECAVILQYISDQYPASNGLPAAGTWKRYQAQEWLNYISTEVHKTMGYFFAINRLYTDNTVADQVREATRLVTAQKFDYLSKHLDSHSFLMGNEFSAPDAYLFTVLNWHRFLGMDISKWPTLKNYMEKMAARPSCQKAMKAEGLVS